MRGIGNHNPPTVMQDPPEDNTGRHVVRQVRAWVLMNLHNLPIHTESAREIASWWQTPRNGFGVFASTGSITGYFVSEIADEIMREESADNVRQLMALRAYINACN